VFDGIVGALSFIQDKLNEAVDSAEAAIEVVKETAEQQVAAATEFVEEAGAAIEGAIQAGIDGAKDITDAAQGALDQAIKFADGEIIQKAIDAANAAKDLAVTAANAAKNALESAILSANKIYDQAAALFSEATEQLIKWINYLGKGFGNLFEFGPQQPMAEGCECSLRLWLGVPVPHAHPRTCTCCPRSVSPCCQSTSASWATLRSSARTAYSYSSSRSAALHDACMRGELDSARSSSSRSALLPCSFVGVVLFPVPPQVGIWDGAKTFKERVVIDFTHITEFIKKIEDFIFKLPALNICKLLK